MIYQKKRLLTRRATPCLSYRMLNLWTNWFVSLQPLVMIPRYVIKPKSLHCWGKENGFLTATHRLKKYNQIVEVHVWQHSRYKNQLWTLEYSLLVNDGSMSMLPSESRDFPRALLSAPPRRTSELASLWSAAFLSRCVAPPSVLRLLRNSIYYFQYWMEKIKMYRKTLNN